MNDTTVPNINQDKTGAAMAASAGVGAEAAALSFADAVFEACETPAEPSISAAVAAAASNVDLNTALRDSVAEFENELDRHADALKRAQAWYVEVSRQYEEYVKPILEARDKAIDALASLGGVGHHFQDRHGIVHQVAEQEYISVKMRPVTVKRTQRVFGEGGGHILARKTAEELGYAEIFRPLKEAAEQEVSTDGM